ncbi:hypothetical protein AXX17_AT5G28630 [Arabidopsis thaliana]|uniref:Transmembrane protein n=1 Tax=Arabidopsis thaliana TaxID=3702 RepID=A0A178UBG4_ARATH|nr:hypothetical protein AXX17_AT5G28630 [Arabidopsis thaliana]
MNFLFLSGSFSIISAASLISSSVIHRSKSFPMSLITAFTSGSVSALYNSRNPRDHFFVCCQYSFPDFLPGLTDPSLPSTTIFGWLEVISDEGVRVFSEEADSDNS